MPIATIQRVSPLRHAVREEIAARHMFEHLQWLLVSYTATNIWNRYKTFVRLYEKGHNGAQYLPRYQLVQSVMDTPKLDHVPSFAEWLDGAHMENTYLWLGQGGKSTKVRRGRVTKLIERARRITISTDVISWFLETLGELLSRKTDGMTVTVSLTFGHVVDNEGNSIEAIAFTCFPAPKKDKDNVLF